ncbi:hypothetical protein D9619_003800 [Psilocybe cf. subviscida]|uniref:NACHT domain-containing protein n=1 Tax=Psilocybe cf. subviscida TaxID=2480587 RepID=A0A8H5AXV6_9AGAR|nr:hypothetical protein D9619_003800 [Psilocybe cf. subviscida]
MFNGATNFLIQGGSFVVNADSSTHGRLGRLLEVVAPNAILNAGGRADEIRCYPGTRDDVIVKMEKWMDGDGLRTSRMMWLSGPAGAGKSAIMQTVAERCDKHGRHASNFFFFRGDTTRNHAQPLVATLAYQLRALYPALDKLIKGCLTATPLIYKASVGEQFKKLISSPIHAVRNSSSMRQPILLIIDGLDECYDKTKQEQILGALHTLVESDNSPFLILVASRAEPHIVMSFNKIAGSVVSIFLDEEYRPQDDIHRFVVAKFDEIKGAHHLAHTLEKHWPTKSNTDWIVEKSSGQFIYAATVMRFIQYSTASPRLSLLTVHGTPTVANHDPYAQLDAVYSDIFSKLHNIQAVKFCLGVHFITTSGLQGLTVAQDLSFESLVHYAGYQQVDLESLFADLVAIVSVQSTPRLRLAFYHASLSDYLVDKSRSAQATFSSGSSSNLSNFVPPLYVPSVNPFAVGDAAQPGNFMDDGMMQTHGRNGPPAVDQNTPEAFKTNALLVTQQVLELNAFAKRVLLSIQNAYESGNSPARTEAEISTLKQALTMLIEKLRASGVGALPLLPNDATASPTEQQLQELTNRNLQVLYEKLQTSYKSAEVAASLLVTDHAGQRAPAALAPAPAPTPGK